MFEKEAEEYATENWEYYEEGKNDSKELKQAYQQGAEFGYNLGKKGNKPAYIKGMRTLANALKKYDRTFGAWTDYFEHTVDKILKQELEKVQLCLRKKQSNS